jgi:hypothetical protein
MKYAKIALGIIGALALLMGGVWILQGYNILPGSFMTGQIEWAYRGIGLAVLGAALLFVSLRKLRPKA